MYKLASCEHEQCSSKDTCKRYKNDTATINFKFYYNEDKNKCTYYIKKDEVKEETIKNEEVKEKGEQENEESTEQRTE